MTDMKRIPNLMKTPWAMVGLGTLLMCMFMFVEWIFWNNGWFGEGNQLLLIDSAIRLVFGVASLLILKWIYKDRFKSLFIRKIDKKTILMLLPVWIYFLAEIMLLFAAERGSIVYFFSFLPVCAQQLTTGLYEEGASRGIIMSGFPEKFSSKVWGRLVIVLVSGGVFGAVHVLNFLFGSTVEDCLWQGLNCFLWGAFIAAIYLLSKNLSLVILLHAVWDIVIRIPGFFTVTSETSPIPSIVYTVQDIMYYVFPVAAILICVFYNKLKAPEVT